MSKIINNRHPGIRYIIEGWKMGVRTDGVGSKEIRWTFYHHNYNKYSIVITFLIYYSLKTLRLFNRFYHDSKKIDKLKKRYYSVMFFHFSIFCNSI